MTAVATSPIHFAGERHRYLPPFRIFLLCNLLYFLAAAKLELGALSIPLRTHSTAWDTVRSRTRS